VPCKGWPTCSEAASELGLRGAGDENRTRTISWEAQRLRLIGALTRRPWRSRVTLIDPSSPWLMAR
jgi:hypothetical protein